MFGVTERQTKSPAIGGRRSVGALAMTNAAGSNFLSLARFAARGVARVTRIVRRQIDGNRETRTSIDRRTMTSATTILRPHSGCHVLGVIKLDTESLLKVSRKISERRLVAIHICMTDHAHRDSWSSELAQVTTGAGTVTGKVWGRSIIRPLMTRIALQRRVLLTRMQELGIINVWPLRPDDIRETCNNEAPGSQRENHAEE